MVSVIIPNYNHAVFLEKRISSVLEQTFSDIELIILDDCSSDNSKEILETYRHHPKVASIVYNTINSGSTFSQWQKGIALAKGEWIWMAESDDFADPRLLQKLMEKANAHPTAVLSYCQSYEVDEHNKILDTMQSWTDDVDKTHWSTDYINKGQNEIANFLSAKNCIPNASAVIFRKEDYNKLSGEHLKFRYCGDWLLWIQLLQKGDVAYTAEPLNFFRTHSATTRSMSSTKKLRIRLEEEYELLHYLRKLGMEKTAYQKRLDRIILLYGYAFNKSEIVGLLLNPRSYNHRIPFRDLIKVYTKTKFKKLLQRIRA